MNRLLSDYVARYNKGNLTLGVMSLALGAGILLFNSNFAYNALLGPFPATAEDIAKYKRSALIQKYFVVVKGQKVLHTGLAWYKVAKHSKYDDDDKSSGKSDNNRDSSADSAEYYMDLLLLDKQLLPLKTTHEEENPIIVGELKEPEDSAMNALRASAGSKLIADKIMPIMLDQSDSFKALFGALLILVGCLAAYGLYKIAVVKVFWSELEKHPIGKAMAKAGGFTSMKMELDQDFDHLPATDGTKEVICGKKWMLVKENNKPAFIPLKNIVWVYASNTPTSHTFVTTNICSLIICTTDQVEHKITMAKKNDADAMVLFIGQNAPWAMIGFDGKIALRWNAHAKNLIAEIEQKRDQMLRKS